MTNEQRLYTVHEFTYDNAQNLKIVHSYNIEVKNLYAAKQKASRANREKLNLMLVRNEQAVSIKEKTGCWADRPAHLGA